MDTNTKKETTKYELPSIIVKLPQRYNYSTERWEDMYEWEIIKDPVIDICHIVCKTYSKWFGDKSLFRNIRIKIDITDKYLTYTTKVSMERIYDNLELYSEKYNTSKSKMFFSTDHNYNEFMMEIIDLVSTCISRSLEEEESRYYPIIVATKKIFKKYNFEKLGIEKVEDNSND